MSNVEVKMNRFSLLLVFITTLLNFSTKSTAQLNNNNRALLPTTAECGRFNMDEFIRRSGSVSPEEFPWMTKIAYNRTKDNSLGYHCLAVLITSRYLLTVAHCLERVGSLEPFAILIGDLTNIPEENRVNQLITIEEVVVHPYYNAREKMHDIALLRLSRSLRFTEHVRPICLPTADMTSKEYGAEQLMLAGYYVKEVESWQIHKLPVVISNTIDCNRKFLIARINVTDSHLCGITCFEDHQYVAGSALMDAVEKNNYYLVGLLSAGFKMCTYPEQPDIFTRVDPYIDWILENIVE